MGQTTRNAGIDRVDGADNRECGGRTGWTTRNAGTDMADDREQGADGVDNRECEGRM